MSLKHSIHNFLAQCSARKSKCGKKAGKFVFCVLANILNEISPSDRERKRAEPSSLLVMMEQSVSGKANCLGLEQRIQNSNRAATAFVETSIITLKRLTKQRLLTQ